MEEGKRETGIEMMVVCIIECKDYFFVHMVTVSLNQALLACKIYYAGHVFHFQFTHNVLSMRGNR
jgi:hypothetical protein